ncbi:hypothetical protein SK803_27910 [Lentzea sp. BCCO 10_0856]|uniref:Uncharacterized protein n=1 Tax=Lentzea miocenica TaxID=3095431 RepID=A0ABU4T7E4_9PSEU|nr:hypothetical protein [Lentzea sp. BCCO 10_0856]MDX8034061.1 hypothetical protein [Lentzea sp. BCCO 10_0856]
MSSITNDVCSEASSTPVNLKVSVPSVVVPAVIRVHRQCVGGLALGLAHRSG